MQAANSNLPISEERFDKIRRYISSKAPLVPKDYKIVVDEKAVDALLPEALADSSASWGFFGGKKQEPTLQPEQLKQLKGALVEEFNKKAGTLPFHSSELENEAADPKRTLVMAGPLKLTRYYSPGEKMQMFKEWLCIRHALVKAGAHLETVPFSSKEGGVREVYTRDRYLMVGDTAYLPDPLKIQELKDTGKLGYNARRDVEDYKGEVAQIEKTLRAQGVNTVTVKGAWFEGGNVVRNYSSRTIFMGIHGPWSTEESAQKLVAAINKTQAEKQGEQWSVLPVPLTNWPAMYHMDTGMSEELPHGEVLLSRQVTDAQTYQKILNIVGPKNVIELTNEEARNLATNLIDVGDTLVMTGTCKDLKQKLTDRGYTVVSPDEYGQRTFEFGGGGAHCMTNDVKQVPAPKKKQATFGR